MTKRDLKRHLDEATAVVSGPTRSRTADLGILALRLGAGGLMAGHGAQKLFGSFGGHGLAGMGGWLESLGLKPGKAWATAAGVSELGGGAMIALGLGGPIGPLAMEGAMATAARQAHWGKPIWSTSGGAELPAMYAVAGAALALTGPGRYSLDHAFGVKVRPIVALLTAAGVAAGVALTESQTAKARAAQPAVEEPAAAGPAAEVPVADGMTAEEALAADTSLEGGAEIGEDIVVAESTDTGTDSTAI